MCALNQTLPFLRTSHEDVARMEPLLRAHEEARKAQKQSRDVELLVATLEGLLARAEDSSK